MEDKLKERGAEVVVGECSLSHFLLIRRLVLPVVQHTRSAEIHKSCLLTLTVLTTLTQTQDHQALSVLKQTAT